MPVDMNEYQNNKIIKSTVKNLVMTFVEFSYLENLCLATTILLHHMIRPTIKQLRGEIRLNPSLMQWRRTSVREGGFIYFMLLGRSKRFSKALFINHT